MPVIVFESQMQNIFFTNLSTFTFDAAETYVIAHGLNFIPAVAPPTWADVSPDFNTFTRRISCFDFFEKNQFAERHDAPPPGLERFRIPNPDWHPDDVDGWQSSPGILEYIQATEASVRDSVADSCRLHAARPRYNLQKRHRDALKRLKRRNDIVFMDADKNLGIVCLGAGDYRARCTAELQMTHDLLDADASNPLAVTTAAITATVLPLTNALPPWAARWIEKLVTKHPNTHAQYVLPLFRLTIKVHKDPPEGRPITGNQRWITQPLAELVAALLQQHVHDTPVFTRDSDQINRELLEPIKNGNADTLLITYDIVRLYPSIPHELCYQLLHRHLQAQRCPYAAFLVASLRIILNYNYCNFDNSTWHQHIGFATGIACGAEVANMFIFILTRFVFLRYAKYTTLHRRFIDDGFMIWHGTHAAALNMFQELNALNPNIQLTYTVSRQSAIFLDIHISKGKLWHERRVLDTRTFQKPVNRYGYTPFHSEHPTHCRLSIVHGELRRYIKRSAARDDFMLIAAQFRQRLHLRGFPFWFLAKAFATGPRYEQRSDFLKPPAANTATTPSIVFSTVFNRHLQQCSLPKAIFLHQTWLPSHFDEVTFINAWRVGRKLGGQLIAFKFPKPPRPDPRGCDSGTLQPAAVDNPSSPSDSTDEATRSQLRPCVQPEIFSAEAPVARPEGDFPAPQQPTHPSHSDDGL